MRTMLVQRRAVLRGLTMSAGWVACGGLIAPRHALGSDISLSDRLDLLYSNQFHFNERGEPQISVGLIEGRDVVRLSADDGLRVLPSGAGGTAIAGGSRYAIQIDRGRPARQSFSLVLDELVAPSSSRLGQTISKWRKRGFDPHDHEVGTVFGVGGHVLDNRRILVTAERFTSERAALERAKVLRREYGVVGKLHPLVHERSSGSMTAVDLDHGTKIAAEGVLWFAAEAGRPITVAGKGEPDRRYRGHLYVTIDRDGKLALVNLVSESELLAGLVPAEIFASGPMDALRAQAVAARGQLVGKVGTRHAADPYLLCAHQHCQVYAGLEREHPRTTSAVDETAGWVAMRPGQTQLVDTVYSANCGGHTEHNEHVWPGVPDPQLRGRLDPLAPRAFADGIDGRSVDAWLRSPAKTYSRPPHGESSQSYRWTASVDPASIAGQAFVPASVGTVRALRIKARGTSGRATVLEVMGSQRTVEVTGELRIRKALGGLRSSLFVIASAPDKFGRFSLVGGGHGHGVGMCQHGAMGMARAGLSYRKILGHYYTGAHITKLW